MKIYNLHYYLEIEENNGSIVHGFKLLCIFLLLVLTFIEEDTFSQPALPQRTITVAATQSLNFGTFCVTGAGGGTVIVGYDGSRTSTGDITLLESPPLAQPAIFEIKLCHGRSVILTFNPVASLSGSNGGSVNLNIGPTEKGENGSSFLVNNNCDFITTLRVGGTLFVAGNTIPGIYSGNFDITFNQE